MTVTIRLTCECSFMDVWLFFPALFFCLSLDEFESPLRLFVFPFTVQGVHLMETCTLGGRCGVGHMCIYVYMHMYVCVCVW